MDKIEQAAILLFGMGEEYAAEVLKHLDHKQVQKIVATMRKMRSVSEKNVVGALSSFHQESAAGLTVSADDFIKKALLSAVGEDKAGSMLSGGGDQPAGLEILNWQQPQVISELIQNEHPQVISILFTYLDSEKSAKVLASFPKEKRIDILKRVTHIGPISPTGLEDLAQVIEIQLKDRTNFKEMPLGGISTVAKIVNFLDNELEEEVLASLSSLDEGLSTRIQESMFPFEKLAKIDDRSLQTLLRGVANETLVLALKGADERLREVFFKNMSARAADMLRDDLTALGPTPLSKVQAAQKEIVANAQRMGKEGKIILDQGDDMVV